MLVDKKPLVYIWRPFYRFTFDGIVWPFLGRVKAFFFAESHSQLQQIAMQVAQLEQQLALFENRQRGQWNAFEQLYLCLLSDPDRTAGLHLALPLQDQGAPLADAVTGLDRTNRMLVNRLEVLEAENRQRWESLERLVDMYLRSQDQGLREGRSQLSGEKPRQGSTGGAAHD